MIFYDILFALAGFAGLMMILTRVYMAHYDGVFIPNRIKSLLYSMYLFRIILIVVINVVMMLSPLSLWVQA
jgi:hypothetical protein